MSWKVIWLSLKNADMRKRLLAVLGMLLVFRILAHIPIPLSNPETLQTVLENIYATSQGSQLLSFIDVLTGGALANFSIMLVGLGPYINASIIIQLMTKAIPKLEELQKEGEYGRKKINQYTRLLTFPLAIIQSIGAIYLVRQTLQSYGSIDITATATIADWVLMVTALTGGAMMLMWLGELITEKSVGNGISLLITVGIVSSLPATVGSILTAVVDSSQKMNIFGFELPINSESLTIASILAAITIIVTVMVVKLNEASRNLTVNYAKRVQGNRAYGGVTTTLPVKLITAGVIPIIFAVAFLSVPSFAGQLMVGASSERLQEWGLKLTTWFTPPQGAISGEWESLIYPAAYFFLVFVFTFFYTGITFNSQEIAENLQKQGGFLSDIRSGKETEKYLASVVRRLTLFGAISLGLLAILPIIAQYFINTNIAIGGTSILILVAVALETLRSIESRALMVTYDQYEQPDFFYDSSEPAQAATGGRKLRFLKKNKK